MVDIGSGTANLASMKLAKSSDEGIEFEILSESEGSLCGGRLLNYHIEGELRSLLNGHLDATRREVSGNPRDIIGEEEFFQGFDYHGSRKNFLTATTLNILSYIMATIFHIICCQ